jgi:hypothetical protein
MADHLTTALTASSETAEFDFKAAFESGSKQGWVEIVKDIVAMANSGGGIIIFGLDDNGRPTGNAVPHIDPADITNQIHKYTHHQFQTFRLETCQKAGHNLLALIIERSLIPLVFVSPGSYDAGGGKQKTAFAKGTVYFRHGAKSEPGDTDDLRAAFERYLAVTREEWLANIRQVVEAPAGSKFITVPSGSAAPSSAVRLTDDPDAPALAGMDPNVTHPYRQKELVQQVNRRLPADTQINSYDFQCVRRIYDIDTNRAYVYQPNYGSPQYSEAFVDWLVAEYSKDREFFIRARQEYRALQKGRSSG